MKNDFPKTETRTGIIIFFLLIGLVAICFIYNDSFTELMYNGYMITFAVVIFFLMLFAFFISYKISQHGSNKYLSTIIPTTQQQQPPPPPPPTHQQQPHHGPPSGQHPCRNPPTIASTAASGNCIDNRPRHHPQQTFPTGAATAGSNPTGTNPATGGAGTANAANTSTTMQSANPCPVPGCNYGKIISN